MGEAYCLTGYGIKNSLWRFFYVIEIVIGSNFGFGYWFSR
jgi:hypothetical protein